MKLRSLAAALGLLLCSCVSVPDAETGPAVAITIDDLPVHGPFAPGQSANAVNAQMIAALRDAGISGVYTFVNGRSTETHPETMQALEQWRAAGHVLANHGWAHRHYDEMSPAEFEQELVKNEALLERLGKGSDWRWFRFPFLGEGNTAEKRAAARAILARRGYRIAGVSMSFHDWQWTAPYARCAAAGDQAAITELERMYLQAARDEIAYSRMVSERLYGRDIPHVLLLHVSAMSARMLPQLLRMYRDAGFRFVSLPEAQRDPAYAEDMDLNLPHRNQFFAGRAADKGIALPPAPDYQPKLNAMCPGAGPATSSP